MALILIIGINPHVCLPEAPTEGAFPTIIWPDLPTIFSSEQNNLTI